MIPGGHRIYRRGAASPLIALVGSTNACPPGRLEARVRELIAQYRQRDPVVEADRNDCAEAFHQPGDGRTLFRNADEDFAWLPVRRLLFCESRGKSIVEYALRDVAKPIGVSTYRVTRRLPGTALSANAGWIRPYGKFHLNW